MSVPGSELERRRRDLMAAMGEDAAALIPAAPERVRNRDVEYPFRQDSDFLYLTGFPEPEAMALLLPGRGEGEYVLFCRERDPDKEVWTGRRVGQEGAVARYGADDAYPLADVDEVLPGLLEGRRRLFYSLGRNSELDRRVMGWVNRIRDRARSGQRPPQEFVALEPTLHDMRLHKSQAELELMRHAGEISMAAHRRAMQVCRPGMHEYEVEAELQYVFRRANTEPAYPPIVGGGANGCILHYTENDQPLHDGDLLLIDAGAEMAGYASDITRTFPINARFSDAQRQLYEVVLEAQDAAIARAVPGNSWDDPHQAAVAVLTRGLVELGLLEGEVDRLIEEDAYRQFFMHRTGHWLGLDVHDVGDYKRDGEWRLLAPGMTLTVEPGLYIAPESKGVPERFRGIGIRIEDDVLITEEGHEVLTGALPRAPDELEALVGAG